MKNILTQIFVTLGTLFLILIIIGAWYWATDPHNLKPMIFGSSAPVKTQTQQNNNTNPPTGTNSTSTTTDTTATATGGFQLSKAQKQALISFGIDPGSVPSSISTEQETCFVNVLGEARVQEIKAGVVPSAMEFFKAKVCVIPQ